MSEVVELWREPEPDDYEAQVREFCRLARVSDWAEGYLARHMPLDDVLSDCLLIALGRRPPNNARRLDA